MLGVVDPVESSKSLADEDKGNLVVAQAFLGPEEVVRIVPELSV